MRNLVFLIPTCLLSSPVFSQDNPVLWRQLKTITAEHYQLSVPEIFRQFPMQGRSNPEQFFEASGQALPAAFNQGPLIVNVFLVREDCGSLVDCKHKCLNGYHANNDRIFPEGWLDGQEEITLSSGEKAFLLHTRFYRPSKGLRQSRFDLVAYSDKAKIGYVYTLSVQHVDETYKIEAELNVPVLARNLYRRFQLR
jgi:hypothetical protein